ncbi:MAG: DUF2993 domain-containing protein [Armatimonadota bacterium]
MTSLVRPVSRPQFGAIHAMAAALAVIMLAGCGSGIRHRVENGIARSLQKRLGPAREYSVRVSGSTMSIISGRIDSVDISGQEVRLAKGITVSRLDVSLKGLVVDTATQEIRKCARAAYLARVSEEELQRYLVRRYPDIPGLTVTLLNDQARVTATPGVAGVTVTIAADAVVAVREGRQLVLDLKKINVGWVPTPGFAREYIGKRINPVFDAADLGFDAQIESVRIEPGVAVIAGTLDLVGAIGSPDSAERGGSEPAETRNF